MNRPLTFGDFERAVITACIAFPSRALPLVPELEIDDFGEPFHRHVWTAIRNIAARGDVVDMLPVADEIFAGYQLANDGKCTGHDEIGVLVRLATLVLEAHSYGDELEELLPRHASALRTIRYARQERMTG